MPNGNPRPNARSKPARIDLAREALRRKKDNDESATLYQQQLDTQTQTLDRMKSQLANSSRNIKPP